MGFSSVVDVWMWWWMLWMWWWMRGLLGGWWFGWSMGWVGEPELGPGPISPSLLSDGSTLNVPGSQLASNHPDQSKAHRDIHSIQDMIHCFTPFHSPRPPLSFKAWMGSNENENVQTLQSPLTLQTKIQRNTRLVFVGVGCLEDMSVDREEDPRIAFVEQLRSELVGVEEEVEANLRENPETGASMLASFSTIISSIRKTFMECK